MDESTLSQKIFGGLNVDRSVIESDRRVVLPMIQESEKQLTIVREAVSSRQKVRDGQVSRLASARAKVAELQTSGFTEEDVDFKLAVEQQKYWEAIIGGPDCILMELESDLAHEQSKLQFWQSKLRRVEFLERKKVEQAKAEKRGQKP
jgi:hypothetical protein